MEPLAQFWLVLAFSTIPLTRHLAKRRRRSRYTGEFLEFAVIAMAMSAAPLRHNLASQRCRIRGSGVYILGYGV